MLAPANYYILHQELRFFVCLQPVKMLHSAPLKNLMLLSDFWKNYFVCQFQIQVEFRCLTKSAQLANSSVVAGLCPSPGSNHGRCPGCFYGVKVLCKIWLSLGTNSPRLVMSIWSSWCFIWTSLMNWLFFFSTHFITKLRCWWTGSQESKVSLIPTNSLYSLLCLLSLWSRPFLNLRLHSSTLQRD